LEIEISNFLGARALLNGVFIAEPCIQSRRGELDLSTLTNLEMYEGYLFYEISKKNLF
jgi:hypothetical protein